MRRAGGLAVSPSDDIENTGPGPGRLRGRVVKVANDNRPGRGGDGGGNERRGRVLHVRADDHRGAAFERGEHVEDFRVGRQANDQPVKLAKHRGLFLVLLHGLRDAFRRLVQR